MQKQVEALDQERLYKRLAGTAATLRDRLVRTIAELVMIPSENTPPTGSESECQQYISRRLTQLGFKTELYEPPAVQGLWEHPVFQAGRDYSNRPNMIAVCPGTGGGRSLLLSGHVDTVPRGSERWQRDPFGAVVEGNRLYGLGSNDMKGGIAAMLVTAQILRNAGVILKGDLMIETIVDEEFGGVNGTLAARVRGHNADAAVVCEPSQGAVCPAQMGGRTAHITLRSDGSGILYNGKPQARTVDQIQYLLGKVEEFARKRRQTVRVHPLYADNPDPVPVWITKIRYGGWGSKEPVTLPSSSIIEMYWQAMPGETKEKVEEEMFAWLKALVAERPDLFPSKPEVEFPIRWLPGSAIDPNSELVTRLARTCAEITGSPPEIHGIAGPCDMFVFHQHFNTPAVLFGPRGGNTHAPDEWVELDSVQLTSEVLARFICRWCGVDWERTSV